ncbi:hypothetical protein DN596_32470 [Klebsiella pneumoniae]|nr:hypothetical protein DN596_32470 [Klebsiella pneumoniae]
MAISRVFPDWTQDDSYRIRRSSRTERGVRAYSPAWSELPTRGSKRESQKIPSFRMMKIQSTPRLT